MAATDFTDSTDEERVMRCMAFTFWESLRFDELWSSFSCDPLQSVKSVVEKRHASRFHLHS